MSAWRWYKNGGLDQAAVPKVKHCVPIAWANVHPTKNRTGLLDALIRLGLAAGCLEPNGSAPARTFRRWARIAGLKIVRFYEPKFDYEFRQYVDAFGIERERIHRKGAPTLAQFVRTIGKRGRWIVHTPAHAQAVVNGRVRGYASMRQRVRYAVQVEA